jgi:uncharacterized protein
MNSLPVSLRAGRHSVVLPALRKPGPFSVARYPDLRTKWPHGQSAGSQRRHLHWWPVVAPPLILSGLFIGLWCWKCMMLVLCQNMIIYNPFLPPNARSLRIKDYERYCGRIHWREERIKSLDGTEIALCVSEDPRDAKPASGKLVQERPVYILYFQGKPFFRSLCRKTIV